MYEKPKFVISWLCYHVDQKDSYYTGKSFKTSDWDTYGTSPVATIHASHFLSEAVVFDTAEEALEEQKVINSGHTYVLPVQNRDLFLAKLKEVPHET